MTSIADLPDPRVWPEASAAPDAAARLHAAAGEAIGAETGREADVSDARAMRLLEALIADGDGGALADAFESAPSLAIARYLWRLLATIERGESARSTALHTVLFALPIAIVAGLDAREGRARLPALITGLPLCGARVGVGPPLSRSGPSRGSRRRAAVPI